MTSCPLLLSLCALGAAPPSPAAPAKPAEAVVKVIATVRVPNPIRPWQRPKSTEVVGSGVVIDGDRILTNAHVVDYATEVFVQPEGGDKVEARVAALGTDVDLAVLSVAEKKFFKDRPPLPRPRKLPGVRETVEVYGFPVGGTGMSVTKGIVSRIDYTSYSSTTYGLVIQVSAAINPGNSGGPAVVDGKMVGLAFSRLGDAENIGYLIPNSEIDLFLEDIKDGRYDGKPTDATDTLYQSLENRALRELFKVGKETRGVLVRLPRRPVAKNPFREFDVVTKIGKYDIDNTGMVSRDGLRISFLGVIPELARDGSVPLTVIRGGKQVRVALPVTTNPDRLIREFRGEQPSYFIHGPLVFSALRAEVISTYARVRPTIYFSNNPMIARRYDRREFPGEELVVVTCPMFEHKIAKGYEDPVGQVVKEVNGVRVKNLRHLVEILRDSKEEFLKIQFADAWTDLLVFRRAEMASATEEILEDNGIAPTKRGSADMLKVWKARKKGED